MCDKMRFVYPVIVREGGIVHPTRHNTRIVSDTRYVNANHQPPLVCSVTSFVPCELTPSTISASPFEHKREGKQCHRRA